MAVKQILPRALLLLQGCGFKLHLAALERAVQLEPNSLDTRLNLGYAYAKQKRYCEAVAEMQQAVILAD